MGRQVGKRKADLLLDRGAIPAGVLGGTDLRSAELAEKSPLAVRGVDVRHRLWR